MSAPSTEAIAVVDLCSISHSELCSLALSSSDAFDLRRCDDVVVPKIDRSLFNESEGSRKQTYSRLRLDPHKPILPSASPSTSSAAPATAAAAEAGGADDDAGHRENLIIVSYLRQLLARKEHHPLSLSSQALAQPAPVASSGNGSSYKSGDFSGPLRKQEDNKAEGVPIVLLEDIRDREVLNAKGQALDLVVLGEKTDPFAEELRRRTAGLTTEGQLLAFMGGVEGQWGSRRRRRRIVDASGFGDHLPKGWKLLLGLKRKEGDISIYCRRYVSPSGKHFLSCKEVSSYILTLIGHPNKTLHASVENYEDISNLDTTPGYHAGPPVGENNLKERHSSSTVVPISTSADQEKQAIFYKADNQPTEELINSIACQGCNMNFSDTNIYVQHQLSCNLRSAKRRKLGKQIAEGVILKDGKFECQICHKTFEERHRYNGHIGVHVRYRGVTTETLSGEITSEHVSKPSPLSAMPSDISIMVVPIEEGKLILTEGAANSQCKLEEDLHDIGNSLDGARKTTNSPVMVEVMDNQVNQSDGVYCRDQETVQSKNSLVDISNNANNEDTKPLDDMNVHDNLTSCHLPSTVQGDQGKNCFDGSSIVKVMAGDKFEEVHSADVKDIDPNSNMINHSGATSYKAEDVFESPIVNPTKCMDAVCAPVIDDSCVASLVQASEICQSPPASTFAINKIANLEVTGYISEDAGGNQIATFMEQKSCKNSISTSVVDESNADLNSYIQTDISNQSSAHGNLMPTSLANDSLAVSEKSNEINVPMDSSSVQNSISTFHDVNSIGCDDSLGMNISIEPSAFKNFISTSLVSVNDICENSPGINVSSTLNSEIEEYDGRDIQLNTGSNLLTLSDNRSHFSLETYSNIFGSSLEDDVPVQMDDSREADFISAQGFSDNDVVSQSCMLDELNANCISMPFVDAQLDDSGRNIQSFDVDMKKTLFEELGSSGNELDSCFHHTIVGGQHANASGTIQQNTSNSLQADLSLMSAWSSTNIPMVNMILEQQCEDGRSFANQKQNGNCSFNQLRLGTAESSDFPNIANQRSIPGSMPPMAYGYATQLTNGSSTGVDLGWGLSLPNSGCQMTSICVWCNGEFSHQNINIAGEPDSLGFICPTCKAKISGQFSM